MINAMNNFDFYKSFYDRELKRRFDLDSALNIPIGLVVLLIGLASYIISTINFCEKIIIAYIITSLTVISVAIIFISIYWLAKSYNNVFKGHRYLNFALTKYLRDYELELENYNSRLVDEKSKIDFEKQLIEKMNHYTDNHILINDYRQISLHVAKSLLICSLFILLITLILVIINKYLL